MKKFIHIAVTSIVLLVSIYFIYSHRSQFDILRNIKLVDLSMLVLIMLAHFFVAGYTFNLIVRLLDVKLSVFEFFGLSIATNFANYLAPTSPGSVIKAIYLKTSKGFSYSRYTSVFAANAFLGLFMTGMASVILFLILRQMYSQTPLFLLWISLIIVFTALIPFVYHIPKINVSGRITEIIHNAADGFYEMKQQKRGLFYICLAYILQFLVVGLVFKISYKAVGIDITYTLSFGIAIYASLSTYFAVTPNNLGVQEAVSAYVFMIGGFDFTTGVIGAGLMRVVHMTIAFTLAPFFMHQLFKKEDLSLAKFW